MLTFTFANGRTAEAENLHAFMDRHFPPGLAIDAVWTGNTTDAALLLLPRDARHAFIALSRIDGPDVSLGGRESELIATGRMTDPFEIPSSGATDAIRNRLHSAMQSIGLASRTSVSPQAAPTYTTRGDGFTAALPSEHAASPAASHTPGKERPRFTFALTDGRTVEAESLVDFVDQHFTRGDAIDATWSGRDRFADGAILSVAAAGRPETAVSVVRIDGDGFTIGGSEPAHKGLTRLTDPLGAKSPLDNPQAAAFLEAYDVAKGGVPDSLFHHLGTPEVWVAAPRVTPTVRTTAAPEVPTSRPLPVRKPAVTEDGVPTAARGTAAERLDALTQRHLDPLERLTAAPPPPVPHVGRHL
jgi:hypothetical protein